MKGTISERLCDSVPLSASGVWALRGALEEELFELGEKLCHLSEHECSSGELKPQADLLDLTIRCLAMVETGNVAAGELPRLAIRMAVNRARHADAAATERNAEDAASHRRTVDGYDELLAIAQRVGPGRPSVIEVTDPAELGALREIVDQFTHDYPIDAEPDLIDTEIERMKLCSRILRFADTGRLAVDDTLLAALHGQDENLTVAIAASSDDEGEAARYRAELAACRRLIARAGASEIMLELSENEAAALVDLATVGCDQLSDGMWPALYGSVESIEAAVEKLGTFARLWRLADAGRGLVSDRMLAELHAHRVATAASASRTTRGPLSNCAARDPDRCPAALSIEQGIRCEEAQVEKSRDDLALVDRLLHRLGPPANNTGQLERTDAGRQ